MRLKTGGNAGSVGEVAEFRSASESHCGESHHRDGADDDQNDSEPKVGALIAHEAGRNPLVDDVALLKEELPRCDRRPDDRDHKQHDFTELPLLGKLRNEHIPSDLAKWWMDHEEYGDEHKAAGDKRQRETLEPAEVSRADRSHDRDC